MFVKTVLDFNPEIIIVETAARVYGFFVYGSPITNLNSGFYRPLQIGYSTVNNLIKSRVMIKKAFSKYVKSEVNYEATG